MLFKDLKTGYPIFVFDRSKIEVKQGKVVNVGIPHLDTHYGNPMDMVVDLTLEIDGQTSTYSFKDSTEVGFTKTLVVATGRDAILREVEVLKDQSAQALSQIDFHKERLDKCTKIVAEFNPVYKEKRENEERFCKLEDSISDLKGMISGLVKELKG